MPKRVEGATQRKIIETTTQTVGAEESQDPRSLSQTSPQNEAFFESMEAIPETEWQDKHLSVTVYRREPPADPQRPDRTTYAFKKESLFSPAYVASNFGGGVFEYWFKEGTALKTRGFFSIGGAPKPPSLWNVSGSVVQPAAGASVPAEKTVELTALLKDAMDKLNSGAGIEQMKSSFATIQDMMRDAYSASLKGIAERNPDGDMLDRLIKMGVIKTGNNNSSNLVETITVLKELGLVGEKKEDLLDQIEKLKTIGDVLGWNRGGAGGDEDWRVSLARNLPDVLGGIERVTMNIVSAIQQAKGTAPAIQPGNPPAQPPATQPAATQPPQGITPEAQQAALDAFIKTKLVEFFQARPGAVDSAQEIAVEEVVNWLDHTAPAMIDYLSALPADVIVTQISGDPILRTISVDPAGKKWITDLLKEMKAEPVEA